VEWPARNPDLIPLRSLGRRRSRRRKFRVLVVCGSASRTLITPSPLKTFVVSLLTGYRVCICVPVTVTYRLNTFCEYKAS